MEKYLITFNDTEVVSITEAGGGTTQAGTNVIITTLDNALIALTAMGIDTSAIAQKKEDIKREENAYKIG